MKHFLITLAGFFGYLGVTYFAFGIRGEAYYLYIWVLLTVWGFCDWLIGSSSEITKLEKKVKELEGLLDDHITMSHRNNAYDDITP
jgi:hypothetical protein